MAKTKKAHKKTNEPKVNVHKQKLAEALKKLRDLKKTFMSKIKEAKATSHKTGFEKGVSEAVKAAEKINKTLLGKLHKHTKKSKATKTTHAPKRKKAKAMHAGNMSTGSAASKRRGRPKKAAS
jgi:flagellar biosynthesis/type III secretory pathway protein FliH